MEPTTIDLSPLLRRLDEEIEAAIAHLARLKGQREGILMAVREVSVPQRQITEGGEE